MCVCVAECAGKGGMCVSVSEWMFVRVCEWMIVCVCVCVLDLIASWQTLWRNFQNAGLTIYTILLYCNVEYIPPHLPSTNKIQGKVCLFCKHIYSVSHFPWL